MQPYPLEKSRPVGKCWGGGGGGGGRGGGELPEFFAL